jgi:hypothetical protein
MLAGDEKKNLLLNFSVRLKINQLHLIQAGEEISSIQKQEVNKKPLQIHIIN